eukprot:13633446-Ditylum_brightwellii.AAC.1
MSIGMVTSIIKALPSFSSKATMSGLFASTAMSTSCLRLYVTDTWFEMSTAGFDLCFRQLALTGMWKS